MKLKLIAILCAAVLTGCGSLNPFSKSNKPGLNPAENTATPVKDQRIRADFTDQGIQVEYTWTGDLKKIVVLGKADAWKGNVEIHAEMDAMDKLVKYVYGRDVSTDRKVKIYAKTIDNARDNTLNRFKTVDGTLTAPVRQVEEQLARDPEQSSSEKNNTSRRIAERLERTVTETMQSITSQGRLVGVRKIRGYAAQDGRAYIAQYEWSPRDQETSTFIRNLMSQ